MNQIANAKKKFREPVWDMSIFKRRRERLAARVKGVTFILPASPHYYRNNDVRHPYRQDSNLFYLTGYEEPDSIFVFQPGRKPETILFVQKKDPLRETWDGFLYGPQAAKDLFEIDEAYEISEFESRLPGLLIEADRLMYSLFINRTIDDIVLKAVEQVTHKRSRSNKGNLTIEEARVPIGEMRLIKTPDEIETLKKACAITSQAHIDVMKACRPGVNERELHGVFIASIMRQGAAREGYGSIVASGANATTLHYTFNDQVCQDGELMLVDAGGEYNYYTSDITRCFPVNGQFAPAQKRVYEALLALQKKLVAAVKPGHSRDLLQREAINGVVDILLDEKLLKGPKVDLIESKAYLKYYMHGVGHWLGLDVHDAGLTEINNEPRPLEAGMCLTIEPGLYIPADDEAAPQELRGLGLRIEDDILVTTSGQENLTAACPKEVHEIESLMR